MKPIWIVLLTTVVVSLILFLLGYSKLTKALLSTKKAGLETATGSEYTQGDLNLDGIVNDLDR